jgi:chromosome partitioning protein
MSAPVIAFFNNKGGVGKTSLVYHLAWMYSELGVRVVAADFDPQANLSAAFLDEDRLEEVWGDDNSSQTVFGCVQPITKGMGDIIEAPHLEPVNDDLALLIGDLSLSGFEDTLSDAWPKCLDRNEAAFRAISAFWRILQRAALHHAAHMVLMDMGPNLGAINRAALIGADYVVVPLSPDLFSLQGLRNLGPTLRAWREQWSERIPKNPSGDLPLPGGTMQPAGYVIQQHSVRLARPVRAYDKWIARIPGTYRQYVLDQATGVAVLPSNDPDCLAQLKHYRSLMPLAQEAHKPIFLLKPADGAVGAHMAYVSQAYGDFQALAMAILKRAGVEGPVLGAVTRQLAAKDSEPRGLFG